MEFNAVLHLNQNDPQEVYGLGGRVITGLTDNVAVFSAPDPTVEDLDTENTKLISLLNLKDGSKLKNQAIIDQTFVVCKLLKTELLYVNRVCDGDRAKILLSGFDSNNEPSTHSIPGKAIIKRVEEGTSVCSAKIYADRLVGADRYKVEITTTPSDSESWELVLNGVSLYHLEIENLVRVQEIFIRLTGGNTHGWGIPSDYANFVPR